MCYAVWQKDIYTYDMGSNYHYGSRFTDIYFKKSFQASVTKTFINPSKAN